MIEKFVNSTNFSSYEDFKGNFKLIIPDNFNFGFDVMDEWAKSAPNRLGLIWCDDHNNEVKLTFEDIRQQSNKLANYLTSLGIGKADPIMLILKRHYEFWISMIALHKIGAIAIPATHMLTTKDIVYRNNAAGVKAIIAADDEYVLNQIDQSRPSSPTLQHCIVARGSREGWLSYQEGCAVQSTDFPRPANMQTIKDDDISLIYFTSGTTGNPKMVMHNFYYPLGHIVTAKFWQNVQEEGIHLTVADSGWAKCAWGKLYGQWIAGAIIFVYDMDKFISKNLLEIIAKYHIETFCAPPTIYRYIIKEDFSKYDLSALKYCTTAGEPLNPEVYNQFYKLTGIKLKEGFGQSESTVMLGTFVFMEPNPGSTGKPSPIYDIDLIDENGASCEIGEEGQICIRHHGDKHVGISLGYYREPEQTAKVWKDGIYHTGDIAWKDEKGFYWFVGRTDDVIKSSGYLIGPFEVESALMTHPSVLECAITGVPDPVRGQVIKATIVLAKGWTPSEELVKEIQEHVKHTTAPYKYPRIVEFVDELPKTISGKIKRNHLRDKD
ncbi:MAG: AMP-binding protein, partial [Spirochaetales bacterium]|nr:AMP-binding protein [Spirochaetales bacterium]